MDKKLLTLALEKKKRENDKIGKGQEPGEKDKELGRETLGGCDLATYRRRITRCGTRRWTKKSVQNLVDQQLNKNNSDKETSEKKRVEH